MRNPADIDNKNISMEDKKFIRNLSCGWIEWLRPNIFASYTL